MHDRVLTTDNMLQKNWPCISLCSLCYCMSETTDHLLVQCNYVEAVWNMFASPWGLRNYDYMRSLGGPVNWVRNLIPRKRRKKRGWAAFHLLVDDREGS
jgi:hypothetical protein